MWAIGAHSEETEVEVRREEDEGEVFQRSKKTA